MPDNTETSTTPRTRTAAQQLVKELRLRLGLSQQAYAARLGLSISSVTRFEKTRAPSSDVLSRFRDLAAESGLQDLAERFSEERKNKLRELLQKLSAEAEVKQMAHPPLGHEERAITAALVAVLRNVKTLPGLRKPCRQALQAISEGYAIVAKRRGQGAGVREAHEEVASDELEGAIKRLNQVPRESEKENRQ